MIFYLAFYAKLLPLLSNYTYTFNNIRKSLQSKVRGTEDQIITFIFIVVPFKGKQVT